MEYAVIVVPAESIVEVIDDCIARGVKTIQMFTAGFRELGTAEGLRLERLIVEKARRADAHLIGPNCLGICNPAEKIPLGPIGLMPEPGGFGFISQSGGHAASLLSDAVARGIGLSKAVSLGNACDLTSSDFLEYLAADEDTEIIGAYLEGTDDGRRLFRLIKETSKRKPVVIWKGGRTRSGTRTAGSHTGALATEYAVWASAMKQAGAINVESLEEFTDTILAFVKTCNLAGRRAAVVSGIIDGGGGDSVSAADTLSLAGIEVPQFSRQTKESLSAILKPVGTILHNPLDLGSPGANLPALFQAVRLAASDPNIDVVIIQKHIDMLLEFLDRATVDKLNEVFIDLKNTINKPLIVVSAPGVMETERIMLDRRLAEAGLPLYPTIERAARALANLSQYYSNK